MSGTPVVTALLAACGLVFVVALGRGDALFEAWALWPLGTHQFQPWQLVSYAFLHGSFLHLFLDMYALWLFGAPLERRWGSRRFAVFYLACVVGAGVTQLLVGELALVQGVGAHPVVGASGGVFGLLLAFGLLYPNVQLLLLIPPVPIRAKWFVIGYGIVELVAGVTGTAAGIAHFAHLGGMLTGYLLLRGAGYAAY